MHFDALSAAALNICLKVVYLGSDLFGLLPRERFPCRINPRSTPRTPSDLIFGGFGISTTT
jgi:hypothetical protein